jgi:hypothetical protein
MGVVGKTRGDRTRGACSGDSEHEVMGAQHMVALLAGAAPARFFSVSAQRGAARFSARIGGVSRLRLTEFLPPLFSVTILMITRDSDGT